MKIDILTLFPEMFSGVLETSIIGRSREKGILEIDLKNIRDFSKDKHRRVDDYPYGGGPGMVMSAQPLFDSLDHALDGAEDPRLIYFSPQGETLTQEKAQDYARLSHIILLCGHYEGIDQRVLDRFNPEEISIGDYVLTGGELPAMVFIDCIIRLVPGVLGSHLSIEEESFSEGLLEYPHYTRPQTYEDMDVPEVLLSGHHGQVEKWRRLKSLETTLEKRPDLLKKARLTQEEKSIIEKLENEKFKE